jgi:hypothetical protein
MSFTEAIVKYYTLNVRSPLWQLRNIKVYIAKILELLPRDRVASHNQDLRNWHSARPSLRYAPRTAGAAIAKL